ncbi:uncharacterized protein MELLADRAFT_109782 [Melampsora larici-populina 98AG31]|uniref:Uncharacterized protein n=1 Tax=Melampsora larici-populina (strain 98AG31 / pathotype 3-4-7) TaxID=747676 RepID=F4RXM2_MELLP|nr:uncharacterized protein MELLADRAFT_109782 [Melampsora larici-populina 98AG31]EGG02748.1 hypothetical protein MELLADRAFT_109782 [Melampsora larici-populina 98AG31]
MLKTLDDITNLPFLLIYCGLSWAFYFLIGIKNLWKQAGRDGGNAPATHVAEWFTNDHNPRRSSITGVTPKGAHFSTTVVTTDPDGSVDDGSYESSKEDFSDAFDSEVWETASILTAVVTDVPPTEDTHRSSNTKTEMSKGSQLPSEYCHGRTEVEMDLSQESKDHYGIETGSMESVRNGRSFKMPEKCTTSLERPNIYRPEISLWPMRSIDSIHSHPPVGGGTLVGEKKRSLLSFSRMSSRKASVKPSELSELPSSPNRRNEQRCGEAHMVSVIIFCGMSSLTLVRQFTPAVASRLKAMISRKVPGEQKTRANYCDQETVSFKK